MRRNTSIYFIALLGLAILTSCSADSPTPRAVPTVVPESWSITVSADPSDPVVGTIVLVEAEVKRDGSDAPDGTSVEFSATSGGFSSTNVPITDATLTNPAVIPTSGGVAAAYYGATTSGSVYLTAKVKGVTREIVLQVSGGGGGSGGDESLAIFEVNPRVGSFDGGETVYLRGKGVVAPVDVVFSVNGVEFTAEVSSVNNSAPASSSNGEITLLTPYIGSAELRSEDREADVIVTAGAGTLAPDTFTLTAGFQFVKTTAPGGPSTIYGLDPNFGRSSGGDQVTILGRYLESTQVVTFGFRGQELSAEVVSVSADGLQVMVITPRFSATPIDINEFASITVVNENGETSTLTDAFVVVADEPQPVIASFAPIAGPLDGGTLVTIFGSGFQMPVQVKFGDLAATDVNLFDDQSIADNDRITCLSPDYSQQPDVTPPYAVQITVTNMDTGKFGTAGPFTYGDNLFISGNSPTEGRQGDELTIYGSGFEDPLQVFHQGSGIQMEVINVSGTQIRVKFPADADVFCGDRTGAFRVVLLESALEVEGGGYTLVGNTPRVTSVDPTTVEAEGVPIGSVDPDDVMIHGANFAPDVTVAIAGVTMNSSDVEVVDSSKIWVENIPVPEVDFFIEWDTTSCIAPGDEEGERKVATPVSVTVTNFPGGCSDTLFSGLIYEPSDTTCVALAEAAIGLSSVPVVFGDVENGSTLNQCFEIFNDGGQDLNWSASITDDGGGVFANLTPTGGILAKDDPAVSVCLDFTPNAGAGTPFTGVVTVQGFGLPSEIVNLSGTGIDPP